MQNAVTFSSIRFRPVLPEESQVNPGRYGAELAFWLCTRLAEAGVVTSYPNYEDWGWFIEYITPEDDAFWLCCGNVEGENDRWHCFLQPKSKGMLRRKIPPVETARPLLNALACILQKEDTVHDITWSAD